MFKKAERAKSAILSVGTGRGFVVESLSERVVVTAAHCLPRPPRFGSLKEHNAMCAKVLGPVGQKPTVWAECLFADPIADIAVLGAPDANSCPEESEAYEALVEPITPLKSVTPLRIADAPEEGSAWLLSLNGEWFQCTVRYDSRLHGPLLVMNLAQAIVGGMSGSPILSDDGKAIGVVCLVKGLKGRGSGSPNPRLTRDLPGRFLRAKRKKLNPDAL
jgi:Trypsin-like peptidase domain